MFILFQCLSQCVFANLQVVNTFCGYFKNIYDANSGQVVNESWFNRWIHQEFPVKMNFGTKCNRLSPHNNRELPSKIKSDHAFRNYNQVFHYLVIPMPGNESVFCFGMIFITRFWLHKTSKVCTPGQWIYYKKYIDTKT